MIKLCKYFYIHWLFIVLFVFCYINRKLEILTLSYLIISVHELSHLMAAKFLGLSVSHISLYPFGLNLKLKNTMLFRILDEVILYLAGPLSNIIMALICIPFFRISEMFYEIYYINIALFFTNMFPIAPLDGGMILKKLLCYRFGFDLGNSIMKLISLIIVIVLVAFSVYLLYINKFNSSLCIYIAFILGNIFTSREKYNQGLLKELLYSREKKNTKKVFTAKILGCTKECSQIEIAKKFNQANRYFVFFTDETNKVVDIKSEEEIIDRLLCK